MMTEYLLVVPRVAQDGHNGVLRRGGRAWESMGYCEEHRRDWESMGGGERRVEHGKG